MKAIKTKVFFILLFVLFSIPVYGIDIYNCLQLQQIGDGSTSDYELTNDIDCSGTYYWSNGSVSGFVPLQGFSGEFNGNGFVISGLYFSGSSNNQELGLFTDTDGAYIHDLYLSHVNITGASNVDYNIGSLIADNNALTNITNVHVHGTITLNDITGYIGGMTGRWSIGIIEIASSNFTINITENTTLGDVHVGILGGTMDIASYSPNMFLSQCKTLGNLYGSASRMGGILGSQQLNEIKNCYSTVNIDVDIKGSSIIGGITGENDRDYIYNTYFDGTFAVEGIVNDSVLIGGITGFNDDASILASFNLRNPQITGNTVYNGTITGHNTYNILNSWGIENTLIACIGVDNGNIDDCNRVGTNVYFYDYDNRPMSSWNFNNIWDDVFEDINAPVFQWEREAVEISFQCPFPLLFCDDFDYAREIYLSNGFIGWYVENSDRSLNDSFEPSNNQMVWEQQQPSYIHHTYIVFEVEYPTETYYSKTVSKFSPIQSHEFDLNMTSGTLILRTYDTDKRECWRLRFVNDTDINMTFYNETSLQYQPLTTFSNNAFNKIKLITRFTSINKSYAFNTSYAENYLEVFIDGTPQLPLITFNSRCENMDTTEFYKSSGGKLTLDNYEMYVGKDSETSTLGEDIIYIVPPEEGALIDGDFIDGLKGIEEQYKITTRVKYLLSLFILIIISLVILGYCIAEHYPHPIQAVMIPDFLISLVLIYFGWLPAWIIFVAIILGVSGFVLFIKSSAEQNG